MPRHSEPIDTSVFTDVVAQADAAYRTDASYAIAMARQAAAIQLKRQTWAIRLELREAAAQATEQCGRAEPFVCDVTTPCGTGLCRYAPPELAGLTVKPTSTKYKSGTVTERPQLGPGGSHMTYNVENAVRPLLAIRAGTVR